MVEAAYQSPHFFFEYYLCVSRNVIFIFRCNPFAHITALCLNNQSKNETPDPREAWDTSLVLI